MRTEGTLLPLALFWTLQAGCALMLALLLWLTEAMRRWLGGPSWLPPVEGSGMVRVLARVLLITVMGTVLAQMLLLAGVQLGQLSTLSFDLFTLANLELAGLLLASLLHIVLSCLFPVRNGLPTVRPPTYRPQEQVTRDHIRRRMR